MKTAIKKVSEYQGLDVFDYSLENSQGARISIRNFPDFWHEFSIIDENKERQNLLIDSFNKKNIAQNIEEFQNLKEVVHENSITLKEDLHSISKESNSRRTLFQITYTLFEDNSVTINFDTDSQTDYSKLSVYLENYWIAAKNQVKVESEDIFQIDGKQVEHTLVLSGNDRKKFPVLQIKDPDSKYGLDFFTNMDQLLLSMVNLKNSSSISFNKKQSNNLALQLCFKNLFDFEKNNQLDVRNNWITYRIKYH